MKSETHKAFGCGALNWRLTRSSGQWDGSLADCRYSLLGSRHGRGDDGWGRLTDGLGQDGRIELAPGNLRQRQAGALRSRGQRLRKAQAAALVEIPVVHLGQLVGAMEAPRLHLGHPRQVDDRPGFRAIGQEIEVRLVPEVPVSVGVPERGFARVCRVTGQPVAVEPSRSLVRLGLGQRRRPRRAARRVRRIGPHSVPLRLDLREGLGEDALRLPGVLRSKAPLLLTLSQDLTKIVRYALPQPADAALRVLPGTSHRKGHVYHPCVPTGRP